MKKLVVTQETILNKEVSMKGGLTVLGSLNQKDKQFV